MIKKGIELQTVSPSLLFKVHINNAFQEAFSPPGDVIKMCEVCKSKRPFLCRMICKYRSATYEEFFNERLILKNIHSVKVNGRKSGK